MPNIATISGNLLTDSAVDLATLPSGSGTSGYLPKWATSTSLGNSLVFDNGTNVGIGTTSPVTTTGFTALTINSPTSGPSYGSAIDLLLNSASRFRFQCESTSVSIISTTQYPINFWGNGTIKMSLIGNTGNLLIGTTTDAGFKLDVNGTARSTAFYSDTYRTFSTAAGQTITFITGGNTRATLTDLSGGVFNVNGGITCTGQIQPGNRLLLAGGANIVSNYQDAIITRSGPNNANLATLVLDDSDGPSVTNYKIQRWKTGGVEKATLDRDGNFYAGGNIGIGLTSPANALHIDKGNATASYLQFTAGTTTGQTATDGFEVGIDGSGNGIINQQENLPISLLTNNTERLLVKADGTSVFSENVRIKVTKKLRFAFYDNDTATDGMEFYLSNTPQAFIACPFIPALNISVNGGSIATFGSSSLTLRGDLSISGGTGGSIVNTGSFRNYLLQSNGAGTIGRTAASPAYSFYGDGSTGIWSPATGVVGFSISGAEAMRLSSASNLLIGTTTDGGRRLQVAGNGSFSTGLGVTLTAVASRPWETGFANNFTLQYGGGWTSFGNISGRLNTLEIKSWNESTGDDGTVLWSVRNNGGTASGNPLWQLLVENNGTVWANQRSLVQLQGYIQRYTTTSGAWWIGTTHHLIGQGVFYDTTSSAYSINASAILELGSTTRGFLPPRMTAAQAEAIATPAEGLMVYATTGTGVTITSKGWWGYDGAAWVKLN